MMNEHLLKVAAQRSCGGMRFSVAVSCAAAPSVTILHPPSNSDLDIFEDLLAACRLEVRLAVTDFSLGDEGVELGHRQAHHRLALHPRVCIVDRARLHELLEELVLLFEVAEPRRVGAEVVHVIELLDQTEVDAEHATGARVGLK